MNKPAIPQAPARFQPFDLLATLVAVVHGDGSVIFSNAALEDALGTSRRMIVGTSFTEVFTEPTQLQKALEGASENEFAALRYDAWLKRIGQEPMPVHVIITRPEHTDEIIVEMVPLEQQARQDREERLAEQAQTNK
ncbi:MAG TPA: PAS domain-containing sensor histidine kinase, partial [Rhodoferax sp.]|nr:PAS domain-containing sensor histidine kinase [Rhodoferax sp.]